MTILLRNSTPPYVWALCGVLTFLIFRLVSLDTCTWFIETLTDSPHWIGPLACKAALSVGAIVVLVANVPHVEALRAKLIKVS